MPTLLKIADAGSIHTVRWVNALAARGWDVHLLSINPPRELLAAGVTVHAAPVRTPAGYFLNAPFARRVFATIRPDLVHAHYVSGYGTLAALADRHPLIMSVWGSDVYEFPATSPLHAWLVRRNLGKADLVLSTSEAMARHTRRYTDRKIEVTPFGIDLERFRPESVELAFAPGDVVVGTVKSLAHVYGVDVLVRAFARVRAARPTLPLKLLLVGDGPQAPALRRLVAELGIADVTHFAGRAEHDRVVEWHNRISIFVCVSRRESFGVAVVEASACERPVVVSSAGGLPEVVEDGVTGLVVPPEDVARTAAAIEALALDPAARERMGRAGRERVARRYEWNRCVDRMLELYRSLQA